MDWSRTLREPKFWLLAIAAAIAVIHLSLLNRFDNSDIFATSILFWLAAGSLIWDNRETFNLESGWVASLVGFLLLAMVLLRTALSPDSISSAWALPFVAALGLGLLASGFGGLRQFWKELTIFGLLAVYPLLQLTLQAIDLSELTAIAAGFNLSYLGFPVQRQGVFLVLPTSRVEVYGACSGIQSILQLLCISVLFLLMFPLRSRWQRVITVIAAILIAFVVNAFRVALMAILNNAGDKNAFEYWHEGNGSLIFSAIAVLIFGGFCWFTFLRNSGQKPDSGAQENA
ncbi:MAG: cyanoexosortase A [Oscillatoriales cyanobacterium C42_A2020_001]|nr:cyanoexosortase A [Leptolyngbyaceae cyanobacterium C42_A2020_001]